MSIFAKRPFSNDLVCLKIPVGRFTISITCDDSCGAMSDLARSSLCVFDKAEELNYTRTAFGGDELNRSVDATFENLEQAIAWCKQTFVGT